MYCPQCGHSNDDEYAFCKKCGASLRRDEPDPAPATRPPTAVTPPPAVAASAAPPAAPYRPAAATGPPGSAPMPAATGQATEYAGFWWRFLAVFIDSILVAVASGVWGFILGGLIGVSGVVAGASQQTISATAEIFGFFFGIGTAWLYEASMVSSRFQGTLGKMAVSIVVTDLNGGRISFWRATGRHFGKYLSWLLLFVGYLMQPFTDRRQALHDMMAGCLVLRKVARPSTF